MGRDLIELNSKLIMDFSKTDFFKIEAVITYSKIKKWAIDNDYIPDYKKRNLNEIETTQLEKKAFKTLRTAIHMAGMSSSNTVTEERFGLWVKERGESVQILSFTDSVNKEYMNAPQKMLTLSGNKTKEVQRRINTAIKAGLDPMLIESLEAKRDEIIVGLGNVKKEMNQLTTRITREDRRYLKFVEVNKTAVIQARLDWDPSDKNENEEDEDY